jgi:hypothetical protein
LNEERDWMSAEFVLEARMTARATRDGQVDLRRRRAWFDEEKGGGDTAPTPAPKAPDVPAQASDLPDWVKDPAKAYDEIKKLRAESAEHRTASKTLEQRLAELETSASKQRERELAEQSKWKELAEERERKLAEFEATLKAQTAQTLRAQIALEYKLSPGIAKRLVGDTEDALRKDAEALMAELGLNKSQAETPATPPDSKAPAQPAQPARSQTAIVPDGQAVGETDEDRRRRYYGKTDDSPLFRPTRGG